MQPESTFSEAVCSRELRDWARGPRSSLSPADELLAEHHLATGVILSMSKAAGRIRHGETPPEFWSSVVEFIGNFMHLVHRAKETRCFPVAVEAGLLAREESAELEGEHDAAKQTTLELIDAVRHRDWEATGRYAAHYARVMCPHMEHEERTLIQGMRGLGPKAQAALRAAFREVERDAMRGRNRQHYLDLARWICRKAEVEHPA